MRKLIAQLEELKDLPLGKNYIVEVRDGNVYILTRKAKKSKQDVIQNIMIKLQDRTSTFNFHEMAYIFEILGKNYGWDIVSNRAVDTAKIKKVFPQHKSFTHMDVEIVDTYLRIFKKEIATPSYTTPTWGGIPYSLDKIKKAIQSSRNRRQVSEIVEEEF